jgi:hypothetical protein
MFFVWFSLNQQSKGGKSYAIFSDLTKWVLYSLVSLGFILIVVKVFVTVSLSLLGDTTNKRRIKMCRTLLVMVIGSMFLVSVGYAGVLFQDDFEGAGIDTDKWEVIQPAAVNQHDGVLELTGGEFCLLSVPEFDDFVLEMEYTPVFHCGGWLLRAQDANNAYMMNLPTTEEAVGNTPNHVRWHIRENNAWALTPGDIPDLTDASETPFELHDGGENTYLVVMEAKGNTLNFYIQDETGELALVSTFEDDTFKSGKIGFRMSGGAGVAGAEQSQFDNLVVRTDTIATVEAAGKLSITWGLLKTR